MATFAMVTFFLLSASLHAQCMQFIVVYKSACSVHASHFCVVLKPLELANVSIGLDDPGVLDFKFG